MLPVLPVHRALVGIGPVYLKKFLSFKESGPYNLRSNASCELKVPKTKCETHGDRAFSHLLAPHCGTLSLKLSGVSNVQGFKQALNTFWFRLAFEKRSYTDASIAVVNGCIVCILVACDLYSSCRINNPQLSIGEWLRNHGDTKQLSSFVAGQWMYFSSMYFHVFFVKLSNKLLWLFYLFVIFPMKLHFLVF